MQDIQDHERRLSVALSRISAAVQRLSEPLPAAQHAKMTEFDSASEVEIAQLGRVLDETRAENEAMRHYIEAELARATAAPAADKLAAENKALESKAAALSAQLDGQSLEVQRLRMVNVQLREALRGLREALEGGVADAGQINRAMQAELESMRIARQIEGSEIDMLLDALEPLVSGAEAATRDAAAADAPAKESDNA